MSNHILLASYLLLNILISSSPYFSRTNSRTFTFPTTHTLMPCSLMPVYFSMPACRHCRASLDMAYLFFGGGVDAVGCFSEWSSTVTASTDFVLEKLLSGTVFILSYTVISYNCPHTLAFLKHIKHKDTIHLPMPVAVTC